MNRLLKTLVLIVTVGTATAALAERVGVKALSGPPEEFSERRMPSTEAMMVSSSIRMLERTGEDRSPGTGFSVVAGEGFSIVQVTDNFPTFDVVRIYGPGNKRYEYDGVRLLCSGGPCGSYEAGLEMNEFDANGGGSMTLSVSGGEVDTSGTWSVDITPSLSGHSSATVQSMIGYEGDGVSVGLAADPCLADASRCDQRGQCIEPCTEPRLNLTTSSQAALALALDDRNSDKGNYRAPRTVERVELKIIDTHSRKVLHAQRIEASRAATLHRTPAGYPLIELPKLPAGLHSARVDVALRRDDGALIERTVFYTLPVSEASIALTGKVSTSVIDDKRMQIDLELTHNAMRRSHLHAYAEVWETQTNQPIAWISGMSAPQRDQNGVVTLPLTFDARWIALRGSGRADLTLRNVRIQDPDTFLPLDQRAQLAITALNLPNAAFELRTAIEVDDAMFQFDSGRSVDIEVDDPVNVERGGNVGIVAVHGWCSSATWPVGDLDNLGITRTFLDTNQSRSHDRFAQRLRDQGNGFFNNAFTVIAHSQGGAAAAHLRTFYTSRLDNATAPRRIQTMGTPFRGSTLMDLYVGIGGVWGFVLSEIFGFCGPQLSLTSVGSAVWSVGIPTSVRREVFYYRTRHRRPSNFWQRLQFWRWRCNIVSFIIPGTDDGVVSTNQGKFNNARDMGIRDSQCHTGGMRHAAQTRDTARNAIMEREGRPPPPPPPSPPDARCQVQSYYQSGGPYGGGYYYYYVDAGTSSAGASPIASYQWTLNGSANPPGSVTRFGPLSPGLPGQASSYAVRVTVRDTAGRSDSATCYVP